MVFHSCQRPMAIKVPWLRFFSPPSSNQDSNSLITNNKKEDMSARKSLYREISVPYRRTGENRTAEEYQLSKEGKDRRVPRDMNARCQSFINLPANHSSRVSLCLFGSIVIAPRLSTCLLILPWLHPAVDMIALVCSRVVINGNYKGNGCFLFYGIGYLGECSFNTWFTESVNLLQLYNINRFN